LLLKIHCSISNIRLFSWFFSHDSNGHPAP
jgi:hypothetical protein